MANNSRSASSTTASSTNLHHASGRARNNSAPLLQGSHLGHHARDLPLPHLYHHLVGPLASEDESAGDISGSYDERTMEGDIAVHTHEVEEHDVIATHDRSDRSQREDEDEYGSDDQGTPRAAGIPQQTGLEGGVSSFRRYSHTHLLSLRHNTRVNLQIPSSMFPMLHTVMPGIYERLRRVQLAREHHGDEGIRSASDPTPRSGDEAGRTPSTMNDTSNSRNHRMRERSDSIDSAKTVYGPGEEVPQSAYQAGSGHGGSSGSSSPPSDEGSIIIAYSPREQAPRSMYLSGPERRASCIF